MKLTIEHLEKYNKTILRHKKKIVMEYLEAHQDELELINKVELAKTANVTRQSIHNWINEFKGAKK